MRVWLGVIGFLAGGWLVSWLLGVWVPALAVLVFGLGWVWAGQAKSVQHRRRQQLPRPARRGGDPS